MIDKQLKGGGGGGTYPRHRGGPDHFPPGLLRLPDLVILVVEILKTEFTSTLTQTPAASQHLA